MKSSPSLSVKPESECSIRYSQIQAIQYRTGLPGSDCTGYRVPERMAQLSFRDWILLVVSHSGMKDRGSTCKFRNARSVFRNLHVDPLSFITLYMRNKKILISILVLYQNCPVLAMKYPFSNAQHGGIQNSRLNRRSYVRATVSLKNGCQNFSYVHSSRIHWKCKYCFMKRNSVCIAFVMSLSLSLWQKWNKIGLNLFVIHTLLM